MCAGAVGARLDGAKKKTWGHIRDLGCSQAAAYPFDLFRESFKLNMLKASADKGMVGNE